MSIRLTFEGKRLLNEISEEMNIDQVEVIDRAIRAMAAVREEKKDEEKDNRIG